MQFRKDINGLRAIAVFAVVLFHFEPTWMPGGYAGVDVFFVISGFLMTSIIFRGLEKNSFSITKFYLARAKRIIPALAVLCFVLLFSTWFILSPADYKTLGKHVAGSITFISNNIYANESGYFDAGSHEKWLLHTWSLSVEWQFYIAYPLALVALRKFLSLQLLKVSLCAVMVVSFIVSVIAVNMSPTNAYFLLPSRMWEMILGGLAYLYPFNMSIAKKKILEWVGLILIFASYLLISEKTPWPGYWALFPVIGAYFLIVSARDDSFITANPVSQAIGNWSYSIYLWHWPLVVIIYIFSLTSVWTYSFMALSFALGFLSYKLIERKSFFSLKWVYLAFASIIIPVQFFGNHIYGIPKQLWNNININVKADQYGAYTWQRILQLDKINSFQQTNKKKVLIIGDSQGGDFINAIYEANLTENIELIARIVPARCGVFYLNPTDLQDYFSISKDIKSGVISQATCEEKIGKVNNGMVISDADYILLAMNWRDYAIPYLYKSIEKIQSESDAKIFVVGNKGFTKRVPNLIYEHYKNSISDPIAKYAYNDLSERVIPNSQLLAENQAKYNYTFINLFELVCTNDECKIMSPDNELLYYDKLHTTKEGAEFIGNALNLQDLK